MVAGTRSIDLVPDGAHQEVTDRIVVPEEADLIGITPHAHLLCKEMKVDARFPDGRVEPLIRIRDWDFNWQGQYRYVAPIHLPRGTSIEMQYIYDNSAANPHNPSNPPKPVSFGEQTTDEMALLFLQVILPRPKDVQQFRREFILSRIERFLTEGGAPAGISKRTLARLNALIPRFDENHNRTLEPEERAAMLTFLKGRTR